MLYFLSILGGLAFLLALVYSIRQPVYALYFGFFTSGILITREFPVVGTKLALPDIPLVLFVLSIFLGFSFRKRLVPTGFREVSTPILYALAFIVLAFVSFAINAMRFPDVWVTSLVDFVNYLYGFLILLCVVLAVRDWQQWQNCFVAWMLGAVVVGVVAVWAMAGGAPEWAYDGARVSSTFRRVNQMQSYLAPIIVAMLLIGVSDSFRILVRAAASLIAFLLIIAMLGTGSRSAVVLIVIAILSVGFYALRRSVQKPQVLAASIVSIGLLVSFFSYWGVQVWNEGPEVLPENTRALARPIRRFQAMMAAQDVVEALGPRGEQLLLLADNWHRRPVIGVGPGNFKAVYQEQRSIHNSYGGILIENGIPGLVAFVALLSGVFFIAANSAKIARDSRRRILLIAIAAAVGMLMVYAIATFGVRQRIFWLTLGLALAASRLVIADRIDNEHNSNKRLG